MNKVYIQYQNTGTWQTVTSIESYESQKILIEMQSLKRSHPTCRVRAVDENDRLVDILT